MFFVTDLSFWMSFLYFFAAIFLAFYLPGRVLLHKITLSGFQRFVLGTIIGMVLWALQGFIFGFLHVRWLTYFYLLAFFASWIIVCAKSNKVHFLRKIHFLKPDWLLTALVAIGTLTQVSTVWFTGFRYPNGVYICCGNPTDALYHLALTNQLIKNIPPFEPDMYGVIVHNYHYLSNIVVAELVRIFRLPLIATQFQFSTVFISFFLGLTVIAFGQILKARRTFILWLLFFLYMGGDWMYLLLLSLGKGLNFNLSGLEDGATFLINPPRAFSIVVFFAALSLLLIWLKKKDMYAGILMAILFGSLAGFKIYPAFFALIGLGALGVFFLFSKKISLLVPLFMTGFLALGIYLPVNTNAGGLYFTGWWLFENFIAQPSLGMNHLILAKNTYEANHSALRVLQYELTFFLLYIVGAFGSKLFGLFQTRKSLSQIPREVHIFFIPAIIISAIAGFFFQQKSGGANTFNFLVSIFIFGSLYTALACSYWIDKLPRYLKRIVIYLVILLTIPRVVYEEDATVTQLVQHEGFTIDNQKLEAATYLREHTNLQSIVLVDNRVFQMEQSAAYLSIFAERPVFLSGTGILDSHGVDTTQRANIVEAIISNTNNEAVDLLRRNNISYIYLPAQDTLRIEGFPAIVTDVFANNEVKILKVSP